MSPQQPSRPASRFQSPAEVSDPATDGLTSELRRFPRMNVTGETFRNLKTGKVFAVTELSAGGMSLRLIDAADLLLYPAGGEVRGGAAGVEAPIPAREDDHVASPQARGGQQQLHGLFFVQRQARDQ